jgi:hypothetical protein
MWTLSIVGNENLQNIVSEPELVSVLVGRKEDAYSLEVRSF